MRVISGLTLLFYTAVFLIMGLVLIAISLELASIDTVKTALETVYASANTRLALGVTGVLLIFISVLVYLIAMGKMRREKTIAFENPDGQVTISLSAIEDLIKRSLKQMPEVKELRPAVRANKRGISIVNRVTLFSDINIPETTEKIQNIVKSRVQDMLGVEEPVNIQVHVIKIVHREESAKLPKRDDKAQQPQFRGSIEY